MSHDPRPWSTLAHEDGAISVVAGGLRVARVDTVQWSREVVERHARVIAAAPDLLAALQKMVDAPRGLSADWYEAIARPAIAKAEGRNG